jgi:hypothetical protein
LVAPKRTRVTHRSEDSGCLSRSARYVDRNRSCDLPGSHRRCSGWLQVRPPSRSCVLRAPRAPPSEECDTCEAKPASKRFRAAVVRSEERSARNQRLSPRSRNTCCQLPRLRGSKWSSQTTRLCSADESVTHSPVSEYARPIHPWALSPFKVPLPPLRLWKTRRPDRAEARSSP